VDEQGLQQGVGAGVAEAQPGDPGAGVGDDRRGRCECLGAADRVVADGLDAQQAVGAENPVTSCHLQILVYEAAESISSQRPGCCCELTSCRSTGTACARGCACREPRHRL
jgi:hypothetical protein